MISGDCQGAIKTWDVSDGEFRLLNAIKVSGDRNVCLRTMSSLQLIRNICCLFLKLSSLCGFVCSIAQPSENNENLDIFVGTSQNFILKGSALQSTSYDIIFEVRPQNLIYVYNIIWISIQGHMMAIRTISFDPQEDYFYTASLDQKVCKWSQHSLIWHNTIDVSAKRLSTT